MHDWLTPEYRAWMAAEYERIRVKHPALVTVSFECYAGWFPLIERYFDEVARLLTEHPGATYEARQVKEKLAGLRLYSRSSDDIADAVKAAYDEAAAEADTTCEVCGRPGVMRVRQHSYMTRCEEHADGAACKDEA